MAKHTNRTQGASRMPIHPVPAKDVEVQVEGEESVVDALVSDLQSVKGLKETVSGQTKQIEGLKKIVTDQNLKLKEQTETIGRLQKAMAFTTEDEARLHSMFGEIVFGLNHVGGRTVTIKGSRSHKWRVTCPTLLEALVALRQKK